MFGYKMESGDDLTFDKRDSAPFTFKASVVDTAFTWGRAPQRRTPWENTVIYEAHVRGFTKRHPAVAHELRGTYAGLASREITDYLSSLGVTAIELLPIHREDLPRRPAQPTCPAATQAARSGTVGRRATC